MKKADMIEMMAHHTKIQWKLFKENEAKFGHDSPEAKQELAAWDALNHLCKICGVNWNQI